MGNPIMLKRAEHAYLRQHHMMFNAHFGANPIPILLT